MNRAAAVGRAASTVVGGRQLLASSRAMSSNIDVEGILKNAGIKPGETNPGIFTGKWEHGKGDTVTSMDPGTNNPIADVSYVSCSPV